MLKAMLMGRFREVARRASRPDLHRHIALGFALLAAGTAVGWAAPDVAEAGLAQLGRESWTRDVGLAGNWVREIVEGSDGFVWIATSGGLSRFDGRSFVNFTAASDTELPSNSILTVANGSAGRLWIGLANGGARVLSGGRLRAVPALAALAERSVRTLLETADGVLWIGTDAGLWRLRPSGLDLASPPGMSRPADVRRLVAADSGEVWVRTGDQGLWRIRRDEITREPDAPGCRGLDLAAGRDGRLITSCLEGIWERPAGRAEWRKISTSGNSHRLLVGRDGSVWFQGAGGLTRRTGLGDETLSPESGVGDTRIRALYEDGRGEIWVGTYSAGLVRLRPGAVAAIGTAEGLPIESTTGVAARADGAVWIGTFDVGVLLWSPQRGIERHLTTADGLPSDRVWAIAIDPRRPEHAWFGTAKGVAEYDGRSVRRLDPAPEGFPDEIGVLLADPLRPDTLWACGLVAGIAEFRGGRFHARHDESNGLAAGRVRFLGRERRGSLLAAGEGGLYRYEDDRWQEVPLGTQRLRAVRAWAEEANGALWIVSGRSGLLRWSGGELVRWGEREGLPFGNIHSLEFDREGGLWLSGDDGLLRLRLRELDRWVRRETDTVPFEILSARDGLRQRECNGWGSPAATSTRDGTLIYPTVRGIALVHPGALASSGLAPAQIYVDRAWTGERALELGGPLELSSTERHLRLRFGVKEFHRPEAVTFRYRLEGAGTEWITVARRTEAVYSHLAPGRYRFRVQARLPGMDWVEAAASLPVIVAPKVSESIWFRGAALALAFGATLAAYRWRTRIERAHHADIGRERAFLREVIDTSPNPIFAKRRDLTYSLANRAAAAVYGLAPAELVGRSEADLAAGMPGMDRIVAVDREVLETAEERILPETKIVDAAGETRWFRVVKRPLRGSAGVVEQVLGTTVDVTDFKIAEANLRAREAQLRASQEELRRLARQLIGAQEEERRRLAREIHDDLTQRLAGLAMLTVSLARTAAKERAANVAASLEEVGRELGRLTSDAQAVARDLHPSLLENLGLSEALRAECATFGQRSGQKIRFEGHQVPADLRPEISLALYRIVQEALRNAATHAPASEVKVVLENRDGDLVLTVADSGGGFSTGDRSASAGIGLTSMAERARLIGAGFSIESQPGWGTRIVVKLQVAPLVSKVEV